MSRTRHLPSGAAMNRSIFTEEHEAFRQMVRGFMDTEVAPF
ncbi:MAG: hypothetical protein ACI9AD_000886, partial [Nitriliruptoraceae bacterium]